MTAACVLVRAQLEPLVDGELDGPRAATVRAHLLECEACRAHHAEAASLPSRLVAVRAPLPPPSLASDVLRRVGRERVGPLRLWGPLAVELCLFLLTLWYVSGVQGLLALGQRTASDIGAVLSWSAGQADLPAPPAGDVFLLVLCGLLFATTLSHLALLSRQARAAALA